MPNEETTGTQIGAWMLTGLSAPLAITAAGCDWTYVLRVSILCGAASWIILRLASRTCFPKWMQVMQLVWLTVTLGQMSCWVNEGWPMGESYPTVSIVITLLAAGSAAKGTEKASAIGGVLIRAVVVIYAVLCFAGLNNFKWEYTVERNLQDRRLLIVLLSTALLIYLPRGNGKNTGWVIPITSSFSVVISLLVAGGISTKQMASVPNPFHEWVRGLEMKGIARRPEVIASVVMMLGWFCMLSYILSVEKEIGERLYPGKGKQTVWISAGAALLLAVATAQIDFTIILYGSIITWIAVPMASAVLSRIKTKKSENSA